MFLCTTQKRPEGPFVAALCASAGKAGADALGASGVNVAVFPDGQPKLAVDARKHQVVGGCVVAARMAAFHRLMVEGLGQRHQGATLPAKQCAVVDQALDVVKVCHGGEPP